MNPRYGFHISFIRPIFGKVMNPPAIMTSSDRVADATWLFAARRTAYFSVVDKHRLVSTVSRFHVARALRLQRLLVSQPPLAEVRKAERAHCHLE